MRYFLLLLFVPVITTAQISGIGPFVIGKSTVGGFIKFADSLGLGITETDDFEKTVYTGKESEPQKFVSYRPPRLVKTATRWYVEYWFRVPEEYKKTYDINKDWLRFRVFEDINRYKTDEYANTLLKAVEAHLAEGYDPFKHKKQRMIEKEKLILEPKMTLNVALDLFLEHCKEDGLRPKTISSYSTTINYLKTHFQRGNMIHKDPNEISQLEYDAFLSENKKLLAWSDGTFNNHLGYCGIIFNWMAHKRQRFIKENPFDSADAKKVDVTGNRYYDEKLATAIKTLMLRDKAYVYYLCEFVYYTGIRPKSEARFMQVKHFLLDRDMIFVPGKIAKNRKDCHIPLANELKKMLEGLGWLNYPGDHYLFSAKGRPDPKPASTNYFSIKYKPYKDALGLGEDYSIYGWKHTRAIHLAKDGVSPYDIQQLFRHSSLEETMKYLRELGCEVTGSATYDGRKF